MDIYILNGPNLNLLGVREPSVYGVQSFEEYFETLKSRFSQVNLHYFQSNVEGELINKIHAIGFSPVGIIINAGAYTHTSIAIGDALGSVTAKAVEVHISNVYQREPFRHESFLSAKCAGVITGFGLSAYDLAITWFQNQKT